MKDISWQHKTCGCVSLLGGWVVYQGSAQENDSCVNKTLGSESMYFEIGQTPISRSWFQNNLLLLKNRVFRLQFLSEENIYRRPAGQLKVFGPYSGITDFWILNILDSALLPDLFSRFHNNRQRFTIFHQILIKSNLLENSSAALPISVIHSSIFLEKIKFKVNKYILQRNHRFFDMLCCMVSFQKCQTNSKCQLKYCFVHTKLRKHSSAFRLKRKMNFAVTQNSRK